MPEVELTKVSSRGQVVIPREVREKLHLKEGDALAVVASRDTLMLKRVKMPSRTDVLKEFERLAKEGRAHAKKRGLKEKDLQKMIHESRGIKD